MAYDPQIGKQITYFEEPDIVVLKIVGEVTKEEGFEINRRHAEWGQGRERVFFLIDLEKLEKIDPAVRKNATETMAQLPLRGMVSYAAPLKAKVIATLIFTALNMFSKKADKIPLEFVATEAEARAWIDVRRQEEIAAGRGATPAAEQGAAHGR
jgi:hypothetical protein